MSSPYAVNAFSNPDAKLTNFANTINMNSLSGVECMPYQFLPTVDRRYTNSNMLDNTSNSDIKLCKAIGRKYGQKIIERIPLLFLVPSRPLFMDDSGFYDDDKKNILESIINGVEESLQEALIKGKGRYYSLEDDTAQYYNYLNPMLTSVAAYLGIAEDYIYIGDNETRQQIQDIAWQDETTDKFKTYFLEHSSRRNLVFYMDAIDSISESFRNDTMQSSVAGIVNGISDKAKELDFLFGNSSDSMAGELKSSLEGLISGLGGDGLKDSAGAIAGGIGESIIGNFTNGTILDGGKIVFPEMWSDSGYDKSYSISLKLRSPDNDSLSIFLNVLKPYCKLLALVLPHCVDADVNAYRSPFLVKAYAKGLFSIEMGLITGLSVSKGAQCAWNDDGLPTQIDIDIDITDLYKSLSMSGYVDDTNANKSIIKQIFKGAGQMINILDNTAYMDFLANMAGLNINETYVIYRKVRMAFYLGNNAINTIPSTISTRLGQWLDSKLNHLF